jgi:hypothetical protein
MVVGTMPPHAGAGAGFGISATLASVVVRRPAIHGHSTLSETPYVTFRQLRDFFM